MEVTCGKCKRKFDGNINLPVKTGPVCNYYKCPHCGKIISAKKKTNLCPGKEKVLICCNQIIQLWKLPGG